MNLLTLNTLDIAKIFNNLVKCNESIASFAAGYEFEPNRLTDLEYPLLFLETPQIMTVNKRLKTYTIGFLVVNKYSKNYTGEKVNEDVQFGVFNYLAQEEERMLDVLGVLVKKLEKLFESDVEFDCVPLQEAFEDLVFGWRVDLTIRAKRGLNECDFPDSGDCDLLQAWDTLPEPTCNFEYDETLSEAFAIDSGIAYPSGGTDSTQLVVVFTGQVPQGTENFEISVTDGNLNYDVDAVSYDKTEEQAILILGLEGETWLSIPNLSLQIVNSACEFNFVFPEPEPDCEFFYNQEANEFLALNLGVTTPEETPGSSNLLYFYIDGDTPPAINEFGGTWTTPDGEYGFNLNNYLWQFDANGSILVLQSEEVNWTNFTESTLLLEINECTLEININYE